MAGTVIVPWYATGFRADEFERVVKCKCGVKITTIQPDDEE